MKRFVNILGVLCLLYGCGKKDAVDNGLSVLPPSPSTLVFPGQNSLCISGTVVSATQSSVVFKWAAADNADSYDITVKNLLTANTITQTVTLPQAIITLSRNTPYSWFILSKSGKNSNTAKSEVWKFYNSGLGITAYAPFPADNLSPSLGQYVSPINGKINLTWAGSDTDNDIVGYDLYFGTSAVPDLYKKDIATTNTDVTVSTSTKYYWKVVTRDMAGNTSMSDVIQFTVN